MSRETKKSSFRRSRDKNLGEIMRRRGGIKAFHFNNSKKFTRYPLLSNIPSNGHGTLKIFSLSIYHSYTFQNYLFPAQGTKHCEQAGDIFVYCWKTKDKSDLHAGLLGIILAQLLRQKIKKKNLCVSGSLLIKERAKATKGRR